MGSAGKEMIDTNTLRLSAGNPADVARAGAILRAGGLVAIPTETVYGLAANALDADAVGRIFAAKGRPVDNPLIVHIADMDALPALCASVPDAACALAGRFWPGPLTLVLPRGGAVPDIVAAGLSTVAVRLPAHAAARAVIETAGVPLAAPSANTSGCPSPTEASHVLADMDGRIDAVLDGGPCAWGLESTVLDLTHSPPRLLRPGGVTREELCDALGLDIDVDPAVRGPMAPGRAPAAPGMKYRHYAPKAPVVLIGGGSDVAAAYIRARPESSAALIFDEEREAFEGLACVSYGQKNDPRALARNLFDALRRLDAMNPSVIYARCPDGDGLYEAVRNRLSKAAGYRQLTVDR